jgi:L-galactose dehydrogenase
MIYGDLGNTGLSVSILGFGALPLGNEFGAIEVDEGQGTDYQ